MRVATLLIAVLGCAPTAMSISNEHPASPTAPAGRVASSPRAFEQIETPAAQPPATPSARVRPPEPTPTGPAKSEPKADPKPMKPEPKKPEPKKPEPKKPEPKKPEPKPDPHKGHSGHEGHH